ncbi:MAG: hypothetical protein P9L95_08715 [Candidatus Tenebribacter mawsonii]|nr:hypothetical protein [Candidatus Tenebribacter mawsonii]
MINKAIINLANERPIYHSEADLQFALGYEIAKLYPKGKIRFEKPIDGQYIDITYSENNLSIIGLEIKYKTSKLDYTFCNELFKLKEHAAIDLGRFDVISDISRLESFVAKNNISKGYMLFITNCSGYWTNEQYRGFQKAQDFEFRLINNSTLSGKLNWQQGAKETTYGKKRIDGISLRNFYTINWEDFSIVNTNKNNIFKYL